GRELESAIRDAVLNFYDARIAFWRYLMTNDNSYVGRIESRLEKAEELMQRAWALSNDRELLRPINELSATSKRAEDLKAEAATQMASAGRIGLIIGALVIAVLIGSAAFGSLSIARPIGRIAGVLLELAKGNKAVNVPFIARGDE